MKNTIKITGDYEANQYPFWVIIDPEQNLNKNIDGVYNISSMITGLWFSRATAEEYLKNHRYNYSKNAVVFSFGAVMYCDYAEAIANSEKELK